MSPWVLREPSWWPAAMVTWASCGPGPTSEVSPILFKVVVARLATAMLLETPGLEARGHVLDHLRIAAEQHVTVAIEWTGYLFEQPLVPGMSDATAQACVIFVRAAEHRHIAQLRETQRKSL